MYNNDMLGGSVKNLAGVEQILALVITWCHFSLEFGWIVIQSNNAKVRINTIKTAEVSPVLTPQRFGVF